jgi:starvation-inducible DNA-binding protein
MIIYFFMVMINKKRINVAFFAIFCIIQFMFSMYCRVHGGSVSENVIMQVDSSKKTAVDALKVVLADSYSLYLKTQNYHWNITGPNFISLHKLFEKQYDDLFKAIDVIAELIRGLGEKAPGSFEEFIQLATIKAGNKDASAQDMLNDLINDQDNIEKSLIAALKAAQSVDDEVVFGYMVERLTFHRKAKWLLKSCLDR